MGVRQPRVGWSPPTETLSPPVGSKFHWIAVSCTGTAAELCVSCGCALSVAAIYSCVLYSLSEAFESRDCDANFVVTSLFIGSVSLSLLEHQEQAAGGGLEMGEVEEEAVEDEETESISVPVHGLGTVSVRSAPVSAR